MRNYIFGHVRTAEAQISLHIWADLSRPSLSANRIVGSTECMNVEQRPECYFAHVQVYLNLRILHMLEGTFLAHLSKSSG